MAMPSHTNTDIFPRDISDLIYNGFLNDIDEFATDSITIVENYKRRIFCYICENFTQEDYNRCMHTCMDCNNAWDFGAYCQFIDYNRKIIFDLNKRQVFKLMNLIALIENDMLACDKEDYMAFPISGFCYNREGLIIFNER